MTDNESIFRDFLRAHPQHRPGFAHVNGVLGPVTEAAGLAFARWLADEGLVPDAPRRMAAQILHDRAERN